jgi:replicative DNA helicase
MNAHPGPFNIDLPNNVEAEQSLLGSIFVSNDAFHAVSAFLTSAHFFEPIHREIFDLIAKMIGAGKAATPITIKPFLPADRTIEGMSLMQYMAKLMSETVGAYHAKAHGLAIVEAYDRRQLVSIGQDMIDTAFQAGPEQSGVAIAGDFEGKLAELRAESPKEEGPGTAKAVAMRLKERSTKNEKIPSIPLPLEQIREVLGADLEVGNLYGLLSSSGEGKTSLALQIVHYAAMRGHPVLFLSYDQSPEQCIDQIAGQMTGIEGVRIKRRALTEKEWDRYYSALDMLSELPIVIQKCHREGIGQIGNHARRFAKRYARDGGVPLVLLDHVRKVAPRDPKAHEGRIASEVNGSCKAFAGELECVWLNLNQRNSAGMKRENPRPISSDMFGGEQAKEDYDAILYLYRPDKYKEDQVRIAKDSKEAARIDERFVGWEGKAEIGALKVRFGDPTQRRKLGFEKEFTRYASLREEAPPQLFEEGF